MVQVQLVRSKTLRPLWSSPSVSLNERKEGDAVVLDSFIPALAFVSVPMLSKGHRKLQEEKLAAGLSAELAAAAGTVADGKQNRKTAPEKEGGVAPAAKEQKTGSGAPAAPAREKRSKPPLITEVDELD